MEYTAITDEQLELCVKEKRDWYLNSKEAIELKVADDIL